MPVMMLFLNHPIVCVSECFVMLLQLAHMAEHSLPCMHALPLCIAKKALLLLMDRLMPLALCRQMVCTAVLQLVSVV